MTEKQTISERLEILIKELGLNPNSFSKALGYPNNNVTIGRIINDKEKALTDFNQALMINPNNLEVMKKMKAM